jgi:hypothetical protein
MTEESNDEVLSNISQYASQIRLSEEDSMEIDQRDNTALETRLARTVKELQARVTEQRKALDEVC